jgi:hypothetical protein
MAKTNNKIASLKSYKLLFHRSLTTMFEEEIHNFLLINQIAFEEKPCLFVVVEDTKHGYEHIFKTYFLPQHNLFLHLISLQKFQEVNPPKNYFQQISDQQNAQGVRVIHLWEDVWMNKKELVKSRILAMIGVFKRINARHCDVVRIDMPMAERFLNKNHLQGLVKAKFKYGLFLKPQYVEKFLGYSIYDNDIDIDTIDLRTNFKEPSRHNPINLLAVASFSGGRLMKYEDRIGQRSFELIRFATLSGYAVMGGFDKMLKAFEKEHNPDDIMTYADRDWSDGRSYKTLGFTKIAITEPQPFLLDIQSFNRYSMKENRENLMQIFNAGSIKFVRKSIGK